MRLLRDPHRVNEDDLGAIFDIFRWAPQQLSATEAWSPGVREFESAGRECEGREPRLPVQRTAPGCR